MKEEHPAVQDLGKHIKRKLEVLEMEFENKIKAFESRIKELCGDIKEKDTAIKTLESKVSDLESSNSTLREKLENLDTVDHTEKQIFACQLRNFTTTSRAGLKIHKKGNIQTIQKKNFQHPVSYVI